MTDADIFISGAGIAGLGAAAAFAAAGWRVCLADPAPRGAGDADTRSTAFLQPARSLFERAGVWSVLSPHATRLDVLRVIDTSGWPPVERTRRDFAADDIGEATFGWNLPNAVTRHTLLRALSEDARIDLRLGTGFQSLLVRDREALIGLTDGERITSRLVVAADGRASPVREAVDIPVTTTRYGQQALAFSVAHPEPHGDVSTEIYNRGGAFTLVPLPDHGSRPSSAVVWMQDGREAARLLKRPEALGERATTRSIAVLGPLTPVSPVRSWPVVTQMARHLTAPRVALVAEAAHVLPPIGAQGLNTSLQDVAALVAALLDDPGAEASLAAYERARSGDIRVRAAAIDLFNRLCRSGSPPVQAARRSGLAALHGSAPLRRGVMRAGLGRS